MGLRLAVGLVQRHTVHVVIPSIECIAIILSVWVFSASPESRSRFFCIASARL